MYSRKPSYNPSATKSTPLPYPTHGAGWHCTRRSMYAGTLFIQYLHKNADPPLNWISLSIGRIRLRLSGRRRGRSTRFLLWLQLQLHRLQHQRHLVDEWGIMRSMPDERTEWRKYGSSLTKSATQYCLLESIALDPIASSQTTRRKHMHVLPSLRLP